MCSLTKRNLSKFHDRRYAIILRILLKTQHLSSYPLAITTYYSQCPGGGTALAAGSPVAYNRNIASYSQWFWEPLGDFSEKCPRCSIQRMREENTTTHAKGLFVKALEGQNFSPKTVRAYRDALSQFTTWLETVRVDWDNPRRLGKRISRRSCTTSQALVPPASHGRGNSPPSANSSPFCSRTGSYRQTRRPPSRAPAARRRNPGSSTRNSTRRFCTKPQTIRAITRLSLPFSKPAYA